MKKILILLLSLWPILTIGQSNGYAMTFSMANSSLTAVDGQTYYIGVTPMAAAQTTPTALFTMFLNGNISGCYFIWLQTAAAVASSNESVSMYIQNVTTGTNTLIATVSNTSKTKVFSNSNVNASFTANDQLIITLVCPTWVTNPTVVSVGGYFYVKPTP